MASNGSTDDPSDGGADGTANEPSEDTTNGTDEDTLGKSEHRNAEIFQKFLADSSAVNTGYVLPDEHPKDRMIVKAQNPPTMAGQRNAGIFQRHLADSAAANKRYVLLDDDSQDPTTDGNPRNPPSMIEHAQLHWGSEGK